MSKGCRVHDFDDAMSLRKIFLERMKNNFFFLMIDYFSMLFNDNFSHFMSACALCGKLTDFIKEREGGEEIFKK